MSVYQSTIAAESAASAYSKFLHYIQGVQFPIILIVRPTIGSICQRNGYLMVYPLESNITWESGLDALTTYTFNQNKIAHSFCSTCGTSIGGKSTDPNFFADNRAVNVSLKLLRIIFRKTRRNRLSWYLFFQRTLYTVMPYQLYSCSIFIPCSKLMPISPYQYCAHF